MKKNVLIGVLVIALTIESIYLFTVLEAYMKNYKMINRDFTFTTHFFGHQYKGHSGELIDRNVLLYGAYEKPVLFFMRDYLDSLADTHSKVFVDIGANTGQHSLFMSSHATSVISIEPYPPVLRRLHELMHINNVSNVEVIEVGLGDKDATLPFQVPEGWNEMEGSFAEDNQVSGTTIDLPIVTGDSLLQNLRLDLIKLDIEGYERAALRGLKTTLEKNRPLVVMELTSHTEEGFHSKEELVELFPKEYRFFILNDSDDEYGTYSLRPFDFTFSPELRRTLIAVSKETKLSF